MTLAGVEDSVSRPWLVAWLGGATIGVANGVAREATYGKRLSEQSAHQLSSVTAIGAFAGYFSYLQRRWPLAGDREAVRTGAAWVTLTVAFEFGIGRLVAKQSWSELTADYNLRRGRTWPLVLAWIGAGPAVVRRAGRTELSPAALAFRTAHAAIAVAFLSAIAYIWWCALTGRRDRRLHVAVGALIAEGAFVTANHGDCPLGPLQDRLGDPTPLFELMLSPAAARRAVPALGLVTTAGIALLAKRGPLPRPRRGR